MRDVESVSNLNTITLNFAYREINGAMYFVNLTTNEGFTLFCRKLTPLRDGHSLPPSDTLIRFLVESTCEEVPTCANCDRNEKSPMFFCNTCGKIILRFLSPASVPRTQFLKPLVNWTQCDQTWLILAEPAYFFLGGVKILAVA